MLTKALFFKPKRLKDVIEHPKGFLFDIDCQTALNAIEHARNKTAFHPKKNGYNSWDTDNLRNYANQSLYNIESSLGNYIEVICTFGGTLIFFQIMILVFSVWENPIIQNVRLLVVLTVILVLLIYLYFMKKKLDERNIQNFLEVEDALFYKKYGRSQYNN